MFVVRHAAALLLIGSANAQEPQYAVIDLGHLGHGVAVGWSLNESGVVAGESPRGVWGSRAFIWNRSVMSDLGSLTESWSVGVAINDQNEVAGRSASPLKEGVHAVKWESDGSIVDIGPIGLWSEAVGMNNTGLIVGQVQNGAGSLPAIWDQGVLSTLMNLGGSDGQAEDVNDTGVVVGWSRLPIGTAHAFVWQNGVMTDLGDGDLPPRLVPVPMLVA